MRVRSAVAIALPTGLALAWLVLSLAGPTTQPCDLCGPYREVAVEDLGLHADGRHLLLVSMSPRTRYADVAWTVDGERVAALATRDGAPLASDAPQPVAGDVFVLPRAPAGSTVRIVDASSGAVLSTLLLR